MPTPIEAIGIVSKRLGPLNIPFVFVGGAVMGLLVDHPEATQLRPTKDVDVVMQIVSYLELAALEERLRDAEFVNDTSEGAPICRWIIDGCKVDIMPQDSSALNMNSRWFPEALHFLQKKDVGGLVVPVVSAPIFIATKLEAFKDRGKNDFLMSHDFEDIVTLLEGRSNVVVEVREMPQTVQKFIAFEFKRFAENLDAKDAVYSHLQSSGTAENFDRVWAELLNLAKLC